MASLSDLLNPSRDSDGSAQQPSSGPSAQMAAPMHPPTSVSELLMAAHHEHSISPPPVVPQETQLERGMVSDVTHAPATVALAPAQAPAQVPAPLPSIFPMAKPKPKAKKKSKKSQQPGSGTTLSADGSAVGGENLETEPAKSSNNHNQTLLINARSRHLKKNDSEPYWRNEVQFQFLMSLFFNYDRVFTNPYWGTNEGFDWPRQFHFYRDQYGILHENKGEKLTFFELYVITMLKSSKISKILKARLMTDIGYSLNFAIICLLVNIGRLNTTVNFDYEMKSQFRTYHSIPSLQVGDHQSIIRKYYQLPNEYYTEVPEEDKDPSLSQEGMKKSATKSKQQGSSQSFRNGSGYTVSTVKQLQDTPRIKSILKSVNDISEKTPNNYAEFIQTIATDPSQYNIISMIFLICTHEHDIGRSFFPFETQIQQSNLKSASTGSILNDIWLKPKLKASDKVKKFLWLLYTLMETKLSFSKLLNNPFNEISPIPNELMANRDNIMLADEIAQVDYKKQYVPPTIINIEGIIPHWTSPDTEEKIDPYINDFDTNEEVEFAAQMKKLRTQFVEQESQNTTITSIHHNGSLAPGATPEVDGDKNAAYATNAVADSHVPVSSNSLSPLHSNTGTPHHSTFHKMMMEELPKPTNIRNSETKKMKLFKMENGEPSPYSPQSESTKGNPRQKAMDSATNNNAYGGEIASTIPLNFEEKESNDYDDLLEENTNILNPTAMRTTSVGSEDVASENGTSKKRKLNDSDEEYIDDEEQHVNGFQMASAKELHSMENSQAIIHMPSVEKNNSDASFFEGMVFVDPYSKRGVKRPNDESIELSAADPLPMSSYEDNTEDGGGLGFFNYGYPGFIIDEDSVCEDGSMMLTSCVKKRKTRRQVNVEPAIKATIERFEMYLNKDNKSVNSTSKNALLKREKNRTVAEFMLELIRHKQLLAKEMRHEEGNWKHFTKHLWDLNMFVEKESANASGYGDWGEFKTTMMKAMNHINWVVNERIRINEKIKQHLKKESTELDSTPTFVDKIFASI